jgi:hypothetical protein
MNEKEISNKANEDIKNKNKRIKYLYKCYEAEICPECGEKLKISFVNKKYLFNSGKILGLQIFKPKYTKYKKAIPICPNDHKLVNPLNEINIIDDVTMYYFDKSIGDLGNYNRKYTSYDDEMEGF